MEEVISECHYFQDQKFNQYLFTQANSLLQPQQIAALPRFTLYQILKSFDLSVTSLCALSKLIKYLDERAACFALSRFLPAEKLRHENQQLLESLETPVDQFERKIISVIDRSAQILDNDDQISSISVVESREDLALAQKFEAPKHYWRKKLALLVAEQVVASADKGQKTEAEETLKNLQFLVFQIKISVQKAEILTEILPIVLQKIKLLQYLDLTNNRIEDFSVFQSQTPLHCLMSINVSHCGIDEWNIGSFINCFQSFPNLQRLYIDHNRLLEKGAYILSRAIVRLKYLKLLNISYCLIQQKGLEAIVRSLYLLNITSIDISNNLLGNDSIESVLELLRIESIQVLKCWDSSLDEASGIKILDYLSKNKKLYQQLRFSTLTIGEEKIMELLEHTEETSLSNLEIRQIFEQNLMYGSDSMGAPQWYLISEGWLKQWRKFINNKQLPPGPIDNSMLTEKSQMLIDYRAVNEYVWRLFQRIYGGGPVVNRDYI